MSPDEGFLEDVIANPDDDVPRLIYADYLEERGNPRGEFIRLQCELARLAPDDTRRTIGEQHERWLEAEHPEWVGPRLRELALSWTFRRGFVESVVVSAPVYLEQAETLFRLAPIKHVVLDLKGVVIPRAVIEYVPESVARENVILPLAVDGSTLTLAMHNPNDERLLELFRFIFNQEINPLPAPAAQLIDAIDWHYRNLVPLDQVISELSGNDVRLDEVVRLVNLVVMDAAERGADRIHLQPLADRVRVEYRINRKGLERAELPVRLLQPMVARLRIMASIHNTAEQGRQRGLAKLRFAGRRFDATVNIRSTAHGPAVLVALAPGSA